MSYLTHYEKGEWIYGNAAGRQGVKMVHSLMGGGMCTLEVEQQEVNKSGSE